MNRTSRLHDSRGNSPALGAVPVATRKNPRRRVEGEPTVPARVLPVKSFALPPRWSVYAVPTCGFEQIRRNIFT